jgi:DNA-binding MarR family transcriptional regulator
MSEQIHKFPPTARLVYKTLVYEDRELSQSQIAELSGTSKVTVRQKLNRLEDEGLVESRPGADGDARRKLYVAVKC